MKKLHPAVAAVAIAVVLAIVLRRGGYSSYGPIDTTIFFVFLAFFWWLISDFSGGKGTTDANEAASVEKNIAFRFGRFVSRIFGRS